nr:DUF4129 domain-containing protein [Halomicroarcula limicola]
MALLCAGAVVYATALFPAALDVGLQQSGPVADGPSAPAPTPSTPVAEPTATPVPTAEPTATPAADTGGGSGAPSLSFLPQLLGLLTVLALGYVGLLVVRGGDGFDGGGFGLPGLGFSWLPIPRWLPVTGALQRIPQLTTTALLGGAAALSSVAAGVGRVVRGVGGGLAAGLGPLSRMTGRTLVTLPGVLGTLAVSPGRALSGLTGGGLLASLRGGIDRPAFLERDDPTSEDLRATTETSADAETPDEPSPPTIQEAWQRLTAVIPVANPAATTPGEYARKAVDIGLPEGPVQRLTDLFRAVQYGGRSASTTRTEAARDALSSIFEGGDER